MIQVRFKENEITVIGHANYAEYGKDIVCAAVSTLVQTFVASVEELTTDEIKTDMNDGNVSIKYGNLSEKLRILIDSFFVGMKMLEETYPAYVKEEQKAVDEAKN